LSALTQAESGPLRLADSAWAELEKRAERALRRARRERRGVIASVTAPVPADVDLSAAVLAARRPDERFFCLEQPDRERSALATLGAAALVEASGEGRFRTVAAACRELARGAHSGGDAAGDPPGAGPVWVGGFAFAPAGGSAPEWGSLAPAQLVLPELSLARKGSEARLTVTAVLEGDESVGALIERLRDRVASLEPLPMPLLDPDPVASARVAGAAPPEHYESAVAHAVERIRAGELEKVVLAREVRVHAPGELDPAPLFDALRAAFPACYAYLVGTPELSFIGASPELLVRRDGARAQTVALAGTTRRSADPSVDDLLGEQLLQGAKEREEQAIVARRIERALRPVSVWVAAADEPVLVKVQNVQHLATPIRAQLAEPLPCVELAGLLHPTPAVGGEPRDVAYRLIPALEGLDRGWYAGTVGWTDLSEDGEFCVALRCALLRGSLAHLYAGNGIVRDSVPADELAETELKLQALLPLLV
jgi:salicylate biosynthesis isochorismate synthase/menaquinone-specific isochorismate synthase